MKKLSLIIAVICSFQAFTQAILDSSVTLIDTTSNIDTNIIDSLTTDSSITVEIIDTGLAKEKYYRNIAWYIDKGNYQEAYIQCDLAASKKQEASFLYLKGELKIQEYIELNTATAFDFNFIDETLHNDTCALDPPLILPKDFVLEIIEIWRSAIDTNDIDFTTSFNIANLYSLANMSDEMVHLLPKLKFQGKGQKDLMLMMGSLAKAFRERGHFEESIKVYLALSKIYPDNGEILADIAGEYYFKGKTDTALYYIEKAIKKGNLTEESLDNAFILYSMSELYDSAANVLEIINESINTNHHYFYNGVVEFYQEKRNWKGPMNVYLRGWSDQEDPTVKVCEFMLSDEFHLHSYLDYKKITSYDIHDGVEILFHKRFFNEHPKQFYFLENIMKLYTEHHFYQKAIEYYSEHPIYSMGLTTPERHRYQCHLAYSLKMMGKQDEAIAIWEGIYQSTRPNLKATAAYFLGKHYLSLDDKGKALGYFESIKVQERSNKFASYCEYWTETLYNK